jgi:hypothetical protein
MFSSVRDDESYVERNAIIAPLHATPEHSQLKHQNQFIKILPKN